MIYPFLSRLALVSLLIFSFTPYTAAQAKDSWAVYLYLCGSDLESGDGAASADLVEIMNAKFSDDVKVVVETGGSRQWALEEISPKELSRFVFFKDDNEDLGSVPNASMGDPETLSDFLSYCQQNHPADHEMLIIWNHGGGSTTGVAYDEIHGDDYLSLPELKKALHSSYQKTGKKLDIIGFDACLMASLDVARTVAPYGNYMIASQATEPGNGWNYTSFINALSQNTSAPVLEVAKQVCDSFYQGCKDYGSESGATLSVTDLSQIELLDACFNFFGLELINNAVDDDAFYAYFGRGAKKAENYSNSKSSGYSDMADIGSLAKAMADKLPDSAPLLAEALEKAVPYKISGSEYNPSGLSCYYPYDNSADSFSRMYSHSSNIDAMLLLNGLILGTVSGDTASEKLDEIYNRVDKYMNNLSSDEEPDSGSTEQAAQPPQSSTPSSGTGGSAAAGSGASVVGSVTAGILNLTPENIQSTASAVAATLNGFSGIGSAIQSGNLAPVSAQASGIEKLEDYDVTVDDEGNASMSFTQEQLRYIDDISFYLCSMDEDTNSAIMLGNDANLDADWDKGVFKDNFGGSWACLDGHLIYLEYTRQDEDYFYYNIPVKYNGRDAYLTASYDLNKQEYQLSGARYILESGKIDRVLRKLKEGDKITTLFYEYSLDDSTSDDEDPSEIEYETFTLGKNIKIEDEELADGNYFMVFEFTDVKGQSAMSEAVAIEIKGDQMYYDAES